MTKDDVVTIGVDLAVDNFETATAMMVRFKNVVDETRKSVGFLIDDILQLKKSAQSFEEIEGSLVKRYPIPKYKHKYLGNLDDGDSAFSKIVKKSKKKGKKKNG